MRWRQRLARSVIFNLQPRVSISKCAWACTQAPPNGATAKAYFSVMDVGAKQPTIRSTGTVDDVFVKTAAGWKFKVHTVIFDVPND